MTGGRLTASSTITALATLDPQGTASSSTVPDSKTSVSKAESVTLQYGTGSGQCNLIVCQERTITASNSETLNLFDGTLKGIYGEATGFQKVKFISIGIIDNPSTSVKASSITVGNAAANPNTLFMGGTTPTQTIYKTGPAMRQGDGVTGVTVSGAACNVKILNNDGTNSATYRIVVAGISN